MKFMIHGAVFVALNLLSQQGLAEQMCQSNIIPNTPTARFVINSDASGVEDGTVTDTKTGLMWMRCSVGQAWDVREKTCIGSPDTFRWQAALEKAEGFVSGGVSDDGTGIDDGTVQYSDWRLPNIKELKSIVETACYSPAINLIVFPNTSRNYYWSSSPYAYDVNGAWGVGFDLGYYGAIVKSYDFPVRMVRAGQ